MTERQLHEFRWSLQELLNESMTRIEEISNSLRHTYEVCADENERGSLENDKRRLLVQIERERHRIQEIFQALNRIDQGNYGICTACNRQINPSRLKVFPAAGYCIKCMQLMEHENRNRAWR